MTHRWRSGTCLLALLAGLALAGGCDSTAKDREALLREEAAQLRMQLENERAARGGEDAQVAALQAANADLARQLEEARNAPPTIVQGPTGFEGSGLESSVRGGEVVVQLPGDVLFDSGRDTLKSSAKQVLDEVARVLRTEYPGSPIRLIGHTDSDPIRKSKDRYATNYHLGFARAYSVGQYLGTRGIDAEVISYASFGPHQPRDSKARSRRVELAVVVSG